MHLLNNQIKSLLEKYHNEDYLENIEYINKMSSKLYKKFIKNFLMLNMIN